MVVVVSMPCGHAKGKSRRQGTTERVQSFTATTRSTQKRVGFFWGMEIICLVVRRLWRLWVYQQTSDVGAGKSFGRSSAPWRLWKCQQQYSAVGGTMIAGWRLRAYQMTSKQRNNLRRLRGYQQVKDYCGGTDRLWRLGGVPANGQLIRRLGKVWYFRNL